MDTWICVLSLWLLSSVPTHGKTRIEDCTRMKAPHWFHASSAIKLCHDPRPRNIDVGSHQCTDPDDGIYIHELTIAPLSTHTECDLSSNGTFLDAQCLREAVDNVTQFDAAVFDLLEKVSGKDMIDRDMTLDRISFTASSSSRGEVVVKDSSAFVTFSKNCVPVRPAIQGGSNDVAKICARNTVTRSWAFLVLDRADRGQVTHSPSLCRCTLRSTSFLVIRVVDVRLQDVTSHVCHNGINLTFSSQNETTRELTCEGLSARYGEDLLYEGRQEVILDLVLSAHAFPSAVWLWADSIGDDLNVSCEAIIPVVSVCLEDKVEDQQAGKGNSTTKEDSPAEDEGRLSPFFTGLTIGLAAGLAVVLLPVVAVLVWVWRRGGNVPCSRSPGAEAAGSRRGTEVDSSGYLVPVVRRDSAPQFEAPRRLPPLPARSAELTSSGYTEIAVLGAPAPQQTGRGRQMETSFTPR
ncbi:uncharacterized protein LOC143281900 [Babylonia areolata]|uniref:uncharacterized protein LOC143281900 n=1 Tax=Babylonia areolata TaxID=304850 RepID=UPI003FD26D2E